MREGIVCLRVQMKKKRVVETQEKRLKSEKFREHYQLGKGLKEYC